MKDNLEQFIGERRDEFDVHEPPAHVWQAIDNKLRPKKNSYRLWYYGAAASVLLTLGISIWYMRQSAQPTKGAQDVATLTEPDVPMKPEVRDAEYYYASLVQKGRAEIKVYGKDYPEICNDFAKEIDTLNVFYGQLKQEYKSTSGNEAVLRAMIENLQMQVQVLNNQLQIIQVMKQNNAKGKQPLKFT